jgi:hypothetical protein
MMKEQPSKFQYKGFMTGREDNNEKYGENLDYSYKPAKGVYNFLKEEKGLHMSRSPYMGGGYKLRESGGPVSGIE